MRIRGRTRILCVWRRRRKSSGNCVARGNRIGDKQTDRQAGVGWECNVMKDSCHTVDWIVLGAAARMEGEVSPINCKFCG